VVAIKEIRQAARTADEHDDPGTADVFAEFVRMYEKLEWWLRDMLRRGEACTPETWCGQGGPSG
jgi:hypothetical protein